MDPNYEKLVCFLKRKYLGGGSWRGGIWFGSKAVDPENEEASDGEEEYEGTGDYYPRPSTQANFQFLRLPVS